MADRDTISDPSRWQLAMRVGEQSLSFIAFSPFEADSLVYRNLPLDSSAPSRLKALEDIVYATPILLDDFRRIDCLVDTPHFILTPEDDESSPEEIHALLKRIFPADDAVAVTSALMKNLSMEIDRETECFLRRTFFNVRLSHPLAPLIRYFTGPGANAVMPISASGTPSEKPATTFLNFRHRNFDIIAVRGRQLLMATTFAIDTPADAVYFTLALREVLALDNETSPLVFTGESELRDEAVTELRKYIRRVDPLLFPPSMFKAGKESLMVPFALIAVPLCETLPEESAAPAE